MGANLRAFHFLRNQELLGMKPVKKITLLEVKEVVDQIVEWNWVNPKPMSSYLKYLPSQGGDLSAIVNDFKGRKRLKALWDVTGYEVAKASWSKPRTKEEYFKTLAVFWSMSAPVMLPSLPGIGSDPANIGRITFPVKMWEEDDRIGCSYTPMSQEELAEPSTPRRPSLVSNAPDDSQNLWHPLLADSEHAYAWWMLSQDELKTIITEIQERSERKAASRMTGSTPKQQVVIKKEKPTPKPKGTTSKSGLSEATPPPKSKSSAASPVTQITQENILSRDPKGPPPVRSQVPPAGVREQSNPRGTAGRTIYKRRIRQKAITFRVTQEDYNPWIHAIQQTKLLEQEVPSFFQEGSTLQTQYVNEEEVLQTTTCSTKDIHEDMEGWKAAFTKELDSFDRLNVKNRCLGKCP